MVEKKAFEKTAEQIKRDLEETTSGFEAKHTESWHRPSGVLLKDFVFGVQDGLVSTLGIVMAVTGAVSQNSIVLLAGLAGIAAGAISMAAGAYLSTKSQKEFYQKEREKELWEIENVPDIEREEVRQIYMKKGFKGEQLEDVVRTITSDKDTWCRVMMEEELGLMQGATETPMKAVAVMGVAFIVGGIIPLAPYAAFGFGNAMIASIAATVAALFAFGAGKTYFTQRSWFKSGVEMAAIGMFAAFAGFAIGVVVGGII